MATEATTDQENTLSFLERVSIGTLEDRPSIPSFDTNPGSWSPETGLRIEFVANVSDGQIDHLRSMSGSRIMRGEPETRHVVAIFGPQNPSGGQPMVLYDKNLGRSIMDPEDYPDRGFRIGAPDLDKPLNKFAVIYEGERATITRFTDDERKDWAGAMEIKIDSIKSGPLS